MGDNQLFDDGGEWRAAKLSDLFDCWQMKFVGACAVVFWLAVILSGFHIWSVPLKAVLVWSFRCALVMALVIVISGWKKG